MKTRRRFTAEFKAKVALEAMQGHGTITDLASRHELHPNLIMQWKRQAIEKLAKVFDDKAPEESGRPGCRDDEAARQDRPACRGTRFFGESLRSLSLDRRRTMIDPDHPRLSIVRQCELASVSRASSCIGSRLASARRTSFSCGSFRGPYRRLFQDTTGPGTGVPLGATTTPANRSST